MGKFSGPISVCFLCLIPCVLAEPSWTLTALVNARSESPGTGRHLQETGAQKFKLHHGRSSLFLRKRTGDLAPLAADVGPWQASLVSLACGRNRQVLLISPYPISSSHTHSWHEGHEFLFWITVMFRLPKSRWLRFYYEQKQNPCFYSCIYVCMYGRWWMVYLLSLKWRAIPSPWILMWT